MPIAPINMPVPKVDLSTLISPEEEGKTYLGPNINWEAIPGVLSELLTLMDPSGMVGGPAGLNYLMSRMAKGAWAKPGAKKAHDTIKELFKIVEKDPVKKDLLSKTKVLFSEPEVGRLMSSAPIEDTIRAFPNTAFETMTEDQLKKLLEIAVEHEPEHFLIADDNVYKYIKGLFVEAPDSVKMAMKDSIRPEQVLGIFKTYPKEEAQRMLNHMYVSEFMAYSKEAAKYGDKSISKVGKQLAELAKNDPKINTIVNRIRNIPTEMAKGAKVTLEAKRAAGEYNFLDSLDFTTEEVRNAIKDAQERVISTTSKGVTKSRTAKAREIPIKEEKVGERGNKIVGTGKEYIPVGPSETKSIKPMYSSTVDPNKVFADDVVKGIKDSRVRDKAWALIMEHLQEGQP